MKIKTGFLRGSEQGVRIGEQFFFENDMVQLNNVKEEYGFIRFGEYEVETGWNSKEKVLGFYIDTLKDKYSILSFIDGINAFDKVTVIGHKDLVKENIDDFK